MKSYSVREFVVEFPDDGGVSLLARAHPNVVVVALAAKLRPVDLSILRAVSVSRSHA